MVRRVYLFVASLVMLNCASMVYAFEMTQGHVASADFVAGKIGDPNWVILDARGKGDYNAGHIPGAVNYGQPAVATLKDPNDGRVVPIKQAEKLLGQIGLDNKKGLIIYGTKGDYHVTCEQYALYLGAKQFYYMDGGYENYVKAGKPVSTEPVTPVPAVFKAKIALPNLYVSTPEMIKIAKKFYTPEVPGWSPKVAKPANKPKNITIIDTRTQAEYDGQEKTVIRGGRIPGAILIPYENNLDPKTGKLLSVDALKEVYKDIPKDNMVILYCHRGCRTSYSYYALEWLGYKNIRIYEDGFVVYGNRFDTPVEHETYFNIRPVFANANKVPGLEKRIAELEAGMEELSKKK